MDGPVQQHDCELTQPGEELFVGKVKVRVERVTGPVVILKLSIVNADIARWRNEVCDPVKKCHEPNEPQRHALPQMGLELYQFVFTFPVVDLAAWHSLSPVEGTAPSQLRLNN